VVCSECPENFEKNPVAHQNTLFSVRLLPWEEDQKQPLCRYFIHLIVIDSDRF
jgi:hypothetical protein